MTTFRRKSERNYCVCVWGGGGYLGDFGRERAAHGARDATCVKEREGKKMQGVPRRRATKRLMLCLGPAGLFIARARHGSTA